MVYQQAQPIPQQPQQQQVIYVNAQGQPIQPMQQQQAQPQVVYVNAQGQPIQPIQQTPSMAPPNVVTQTTVIQNNARIIDDDPSCLYIFAFFAIFIPLVGAIGMCVYNCGNGLGPKRTQAFRVLCICTLIGFIWVVAYSVS